MPIKFGRLSKLLTVVLALAIVGAVFAVNQARPSGHTTTLSTRLASATRVAEIHNGSGYWLVGSDGGVFTYGDAKFYGSMAGKHLNSPITGIVATADAKGYWEVAKDGGVFAFGDARFQGSMGNSALAAPVVGMASSTAASAAGPVGLLVLRVQRVQRVQRDQGEPRTPGTGWTARHHRCGGSEY